MLNVVIATLFDRHHWLAGHLAESGFKVTLVDFDPVFEAWEVEDFEGPFGFFDSSRLDAGQRYSLYQGGEIRISPEGFTVWNANGPLELRGALSAHQYRQSRLADLTREYLGASESLSLEKIRRDLLQKLESHSYEQAWLAHLAHSLSATAAVEFPESLRYGHPSPLYADFGVRHSTRTSLEAQREDLKKKGVKVLVAKNIAGVVIKGKKLVALDLEVGSKVSNIEADEFVWGLSRAETEIANHGVSTQIYKFAAQEPVWTWIRFRLDTTSHRMLNAMPQHLLVVEDIFAPLARENGFIMQKCQSEIGWDVWTRVAGYRRNEPLHIEEVKQGISRVLTSRIPGLKIKSCDLAAGVKKNYPAIFSQFALEASKKNSALELNNVWLSSLENSEHLDSTGRLETQSVLASELIKKGISKPSKAVEAQP